MTLYKEKEHICELQHDAYSMYIASENMAVPADFLFFGSYGEINLGTENFNFFHGGGVVSSSLVGCGGVSAFLGGGGVEDSGGAGEGCGLGDGGGDGG